MPSKAKNHAQILINTYLIISAMYKLDYMASFNAKNTTALEQLKYRNYNFMTIYTSSQVQENSRFFKVTQQLRGV